VTIRAEPRARRDGVLTPAHMAVWVRFLKAHSAITRELERDLAERHGLTLSDFDVLVQLRDGGPRGLRPVELARRVLLTRSGITRLLQGLEREGLVERVECEEDRRGSYVALTEAGRATLRSASRTHHAGIAELFARPLAGEDLAALGAVLERLTPPAGPA
jgi:DNA-binding MarR family transcriptional regulator